MDADMLTAYNLKFPIAIGLSILALAIIHYFLNFSTTG